MNKMKINIAKSPLVFMGIMLCLGGCNTDYLGYDTELQDGIYFPSDSLNFQFGMNKGESFDYIMGVTVLGLPRESDREFVVEVLPDETTATEGLHYEMAKKFTVPAGKVSGLIPLTLYRYKDPEIAKNNVVIKLRLNANDNFRLVINSECKLVFSDTELPKPRWWSETYFGPYSQLLRMDIFYYYWQLQETHPQLYDRIVEEYGKNLEKAVGFPTQQKIAFIKYIITPAYEYYLEHPNPRVDIPDPATLL